jgi:HlyD family secretion protein
VTSPRPEDLGAAQAALDQAQTKLAQLIDQPRTAKPEDVANAELAVSSAQVAYDKAVSDTGAVQGPDAPTRQAADAAVKQALIGVQTAQNSLAKLTSQGPSEWDVRAQQQAVEAAQNSLARLTRPSPADVQAARAAVEQAQNSLAKLLSPDPFDVQAAQESVQAARVSLDLLLAPSPADVAAARQPVVAAQASLDKLLAPAELDVATAQQAVAQAQAGVDKLLQGNTYDVQAAQFALAQQQASLDLKRAGPSAQDVLVATAAVEQADAQLKQAEANLAAATLTAPFGGYVAATGVNPGEQVAAGTAAVTLVDARPARVDVLVNETDVPRVKPGQQVSLTFESLPELQLAGRVAVVVRVPTVQQSVVSYQVQIELDAAPTEDILPGMTASAEIVTATRSNALVAPNLGIRTLGGVKTVDVLEADGTSAPRTVATGLSGERGTEVLSGLRPGDLVVIPSSAAAPAAPGPGGLGR